MNERDWLKSLDRPAPTPPPVDVTHSVLADIRRRAPASADAPDPFLRLFTLAAGVAAIVIASVATTQLYSVLANPLQSLTSPLTTMVMQ